MSDTKRKQFLTTTEAAQYCGVSFRTVIRWIGRGYLQAIKLPGRGDHRIQIPNFVEFLKNNDMPVPDDLANYETGSNIAQVEVQVEAPETKNESSIPKVLVIEDDEYMIKAVVSALSQKGYETQTVGNGFEAGLRIEAWQPHAVVLNLMMPEINATQLISILKKSQRYAGIKVIAVSGVKESDLAKLRHLGVDGAIGHPFSEEKLLLQVQKVIAR